MYQSYYNLTGRPFRLSPDPGFFFPSRGHKRALAYLRYGLNQNEGFVVITGAPGTGKTTLAQILLEELGDKNVVVAHLTTTQLDADDMLRMVAASFGLRYEGLDKAALLKTIESFLLARSRERKRALLVVDEAQNLPARSLEELRMLSNLQVGDKALLQTFLLGQNQFRQMLDHPDLEQLRQRVIANFHLGPLAADENQRYIESRLRLVNWENDPRFAEIAFEKIHTYTEGIPRRINMLCDRILLFGCMEEKNEITGELVDLVVKELEQEISGASVSSSTSKPDRVADIPPTMEPVIKPKAQPAKVKMPDQTQRYEPSKPAALPIDSAATEVEEITPANFPAEIEETVVDYEEQQESAVEKLKNVTTQARTEPARTEPVRQEPVINESASIESNEVDFIEITEDFLDEFDRTMSADSVPEKSEPVIKEARQKPKPKPKAKAKEKPARPRGEARDKKRSQHKENLAETKEKNKVAVPEPTTEKEIVDEDVLGNTVKHKKVSEVEDDSSNKVTEQPAVQESSPQISERELFRVIPGGKNDSPQRVEEQVEPMAPAARHAPTSEDVVLRRILRLVLAFHRSPSSFPGLDDPSQPLPEGVSELLELAVSDDQVLTKVSPASVMGISPVMLRAAVRFFVRRTLFVGNGDHYRILGLAGNATQMEVEKHYDLLMRLLRQDKQAGVNECVAMVGQAYEALTRHDDRAPAPQQINVVDSDDKAAAVLQALENPELTIDFNDEVKQEERPTPVSTIMSMPHDVSRPDPRVTRRRIHILGQAAIVGIGGLVFVLGILITQLEPGDNEKEAKAPTQVAKPVAPETTNPKMVASVDDKAKAKADSKEGRLGLSFNDGTSDVIRNDESASVAGEEPPVSLVAAKNASASTKTASRAAQSKAAAVKEKPFVAPSPKPKAKPKPAPTLAPTPKAEPKSVIAKAEVVPVLPKEAAAKSAGAATGSSDSAAKSSASSTFAPVPVQTKPNTKPVEVKQATLSSQKSSQQNSQQSPQRSSASSATPKTVVPVTPKADATASVPNNQFEGKDIPVSSAPQLTQTAPGLGILPEETVQQKLSITEDKLQTLLKDFTLAYDNGDVNSIMQLFSGTARTNEQTSRAGIESEYKKLFGATISRDITMDSLFWDNDGDFARGVGQFRVDVTSKDGSNNNVKGKFTMQVQAESGGVKITRLYLSEKIALKKAPAPVGPTSNDLKKLLTDFTRFYEAGNINRLMTLFSDNAQTNDQNTLAGIRKDHLDLFNSTQVRQIFLKDINWKVTGTNASGNGNFEVMIQNKGQDAFATVGGTVDISVTKTKNGITKITRFFHKVSQ